MARRKRKQSEAERVIKMLDCVLWHLAEIDVAKRVALEELGSDDEFVSGLLPPRRSSRTCATFQFPRD